MIGLGVTSILTPNSTPLEINNLGFAFESREAFASQVRTPLLLERSNPWQHTCIDPEIVSLLIIGTYTRGRRKYVEN